MFRDVRFIVSRDGALRGVVSEGTRERARSDDELERRSLDAGPSCLDLVKLLLGSV